MGFNLSKQDKKSALLVTFAAILQMAESMFPQPMPGIKLGLANMVTLVAIADLGFAAAVEIAVLRTVISSLLLGTFFSPSFMLSFSSALTSSVAMGGAYALARRLRVPGFGFIGISIIGAAVHNITQVTLVYTVLLRHPGVFMLLPWLGVSSVVTGWITGTVAAMVCERLRKNGNTGELYGMRAVTGGGRSFAGRYVGGTSPFHTMDPAVKIAMTALFACAILLSSGAASFALVTLSLLAACAAAGVKPSLIFSGAKRMAGFLAFSFVLPMFFGPDGNTIAQFGPVRVTDAGVASGAVFAARLVLLSAAAAFMIRTTEPERLASGIRTLLRPLKFAGISGDRTSGIIVSSWVMVPLYWDRAVALVKERTGKDKAGLKSALVTAASVIVALYGSAEI